MSPLPQEEATCVLFQIGESRFALPVEAVDEVLALPEITRVPGWGPPLLGVVNLRGRWIPVLDVGERLGAGPAQACAASFLVLLADPALGCAVLVDAVHGLATAVPAPACAILPVALGQRPPLCSGLVRFEGQNVSVLSAPDLLDPAQVGAARDAPPLVAPGAAPEAPSAAEAAP